MTTTLQKLLKYPHAAVFDKSPVPELALRIRHDAGATWSIAENVMTVTSGDLVRTFDLSEYTIGSLASALEAEGFQVPAISPAWQGRSALVLAEGSGDQNESNGDHVHAFTSLLWVLLSAYAVEVREAERQVGNALQQMVLTTAEGEWLDLWGYLYGVPRKQGELDPAYRLHIKKEAFRLRVNKFAIEQAITDQTGDDIRIIEPWRLMFRLDDSVLSGPHRLQDANYYNYHVIQATGPSGADWEAIRAIVDRNRAAGVIQYQHKAIAPGSVLISGVWEDATLLTSRTAIHGAKDIWDDRTLLDYSRIEDIPVLNHASLRRRTLRRTSMSKLTDRPWLAAPWPAAGWGEVVAFIDSKHSRSYRVHYSLSTYEGRDWPRQPWSGRWTDSTSVESGHSQLS